MENEQCGICWNLKFDKQGGYTHRDLKNFHNFVSLDYCLKCNEPKYDQSGFPTHSRRKNESIPLGNSRKSHRFISGIQAEIHKKQRKKKRVFTIIVSVGVVLTASLSNIFF